MPYTFRKAVRANTTILVGLAGYTGTGKTMSMLRLAEGLRGDGKVLMLDTEAGRGTHYADRFDYDYAEIKPPFSPQTYREAIEQADDAGYRVILLDSMSHEWAGDGGCADMQAEALERMAKGDPSKMERLTAPAWRDAKVAHKRMMSRLLQCRAHLVFGLRAEPKIKFVKVRDQQTGRDRTVIEDAGYQPICEKSFMFEMTVSFMLNEQHLPVPIKLPDNFKPFFPLDQPITEDSGKRLAEWAKGGNSQPASQQPDSVDAALNDLKVTLTRYGYAGESDVQKKNRAAALMGAFGTSSWSAISAKSMEEVRDGITKLRKTNEPAA